MALNVGYISLNYYDFFFFFTTHKPNLCLRSNFKNFFRNDAEFGFSQCKHNERTFWILCKYFGFRAYKRLLSVGISEGYFLTLCKQFGIWVCKCLLPVGISEGYFKFFCKTPYKLPSPSAYIVEGIFKKLFELFRKQRIWGVHFGGACSNKWRDI